MSHMRPMAGYQPDQPHRRRSDGDTSHPWKLTARGWLALGASVVAAGAATGLLWPGAGPGPTYTTPKGVVVEAPPFDVKPFSGLTFTDKDVTVPTIVGLGQAELDVDGDPSPEELVYLGAVVVPLPDGDTLVEPMTGTKQQLREVYVSPSELVAGHRVTVGLADQASVTLSAAPNSRNNGLDITFSSRPGAVFPQGQPQLPGQ